MEIVKQIINNRSISVPILAWAITQIMKVILVLLQERRIDFRRFVGSGGMPSSHSAFVVSLAVVVGRINGFESSLFGIAAVVAMVTMYDAAGVRRAAGKQAEVLNKLIYNHDTLTFEEELKELLGHTPFQVIIGAILGVLFGIAFT